MESCILLLILEGWWGTLLECYRSNASTVLNMDNEDTIKEEALKLFICYIELLQTNIKGAVNILEDKIRGQLILSSELRPWHLLNVLEKFEKSEQFISLATIFSKAYGNGSSHSAIDKLKNYFKRSRLYLDISKGDPIGFNDRFEELWSAFNERKVKETTIRPINNVAFPKKLIDFGKFKIQKFSKDELDVLLNQEVCAAFYPYAVVDTEKLSLFWHITEERVITRNKETLKINLLDIMGCTWDEVFRVQRTFPDSPLQLLALFDWGKASNHTGHEEQKREYWLEIFDLPFEYKYTISSDLIDSPNASPNLSKLYLEPIIDQSGEEIGERPNCNIHLDVSELDDLENLVRTAKSFIENINLKECKWEFIEIAMGSLAKAFFSDGVEQLLWNMTALESLIGEKTQTTQNIRRRLGLIWGGKDKKKIEGIRKEFNELYDFRSSLVHGSKFGEGKNVLYRYHLKLARDYTRKTVLWFIRYLSYIHGELEKGAVPLSKYPKQEDLLSLLDYQIQSFEHEDTKITMPNNFSDTDFVVG